MQWPSTHLQGLTTSTHAVQYWNDKARQIMENHKIPVMDAFWMSLSRPDHRECTIENDRGNKMAHAGPEIYDVLVKQWAIMTLEAMATS